MTTEAFSKFGIYNIYVLNTLYLVAHVDANVEGILHCDVNVRGVWCAKHRSARAQLRWVINYNPSCAKQNCAWTRLGLSWDAL